MKIGTIHVEDATKVALLVGDLAVELHAAAREHGNDEVATLPDELLGIVEAGAPAWDAAETFNDALRAAPPTAAAWARPAADVHWAPPLIPTKNPWVIGANYLEHLANGYRRIGRPAVAPPHVEFFSKAISSIVGDGDDIVYDKRATVTVDYECELTVVLGTRARDIPVGEAYEHVFGYTVGNDISARELQLGHRQYFRGKSQDGFCPIGPVIATTRDVPNPNELRIRQWVNGELRQDWPVGDMLYNVDELIAVLSQGMTVEPGDMIVCGTVPGVGFEQMPQVWLQHGDVLEAEITRIGRLTNTIKQAGIS